MTTRERLLKGDGFFANGYTGRYRIQPGIAEDEFWIWHCGMMLYEVEFREHSLSYSRFDFGKQHGGTIRFKDIVFE